MSINNTSIIIVFNQYIYTNMGARDAREHLIFDCLRANGSNSAMVVMVSSYADDTQMYVPLPANDYTSVESLCYCLELNSILFI